MHIYIWHIHLEPFNDPSNFQGQEELSTPSDPFADPIRASRLAARSA